MTALVEASGTSHVGLVSKENQDNYVCLDEYGLWVIADGMGGHVAGEIASQLAIEAMLSSFHSGSLLAEAVADTHPQLLDAIDNDVSLKGMGTTMVAVHLEGNEYQLAWVGDSRCYQWTNSGLAQISRDHSYLELLLERGQMSAEEALLHPQRKSLVNAIGVDHKMQFEVSSYNSQLYRGECLLLCSDGLTDELDDQEIALILGKKQDVNTTCRELLDAALVSGGRDNITIIVIRATDNMPEREPANSSTTRALPTGVPVSRSSAWLLVVGAVIVIVTAFLMLK